MENQELDNNNEIEKENIISENEVSVSHEESNQLDTMSPEELLEKISLIAKEKTSETNTKEFLSVKDVLQQKLNKEKNTPDAVINPIQGELNDLIVVYKKKFNDFHKNQEVGFEENYEIRLKIIDRLKNLYTNTEPGTNLFRAIREIKEDWGNAGLVAKTKFKNLNNDYFFHLNRFYQMLDLNKEYREQEYAHNLEKRKHIIQRSKELVDEPLVQKALNELQHLHKLWKEEAEPVAEEFRETTWEEFKEISNKVHDRKSEIFADIDAKQKETLIKKEQIIEDIKKLSFPEKDGHNYWQQTMRKVEELRTEFLQLGYVPKKLSVKNWSNFNDALRGFNNEKNKFYKNLKNIQSENLEEKKKLIKTAQDNMNSEDWEIAVPLFKKLQEDWRNLSHVPQKRTNKAWDEFRDACNTFFDNYRTKNNAEKEDWNENFKLKKALLDELKTIDNSEESIEKIGIIKSNWNNIGKVPRENIAINTEFNKTLTEKLKLNKINEFDLKEEGLTGTEITDKARRIKNQIGDLESEISKLENNLSFFSNPSRDNPLLKDTFATLDNKIVQVDSLKDSLHRIIMENK